MNDLTLSVKESNPDGFAQLSQRESLSGNPGFPEPLANWTAKIAANWEVAWPGKTVWRGASQ